MLTTRRLALLVTFIGLFAMAMKPSVDTDSFWHLRAGAWMIDNVRLLNFDVFSYTRLNQPWINHSWLSQIILAAVYRAGGYGALNFFTALVITSTFFITDRINAGNEYVRAFALVLAATTSSVYWSARPQILSLLFTAIFVFILFKFLWQGVNRLWLLPPLMLLWVNLHGGFALGFILLVIAMLGELVQELIKEKRLKIKDTNWVWIGGCGLACAACACINPYGAQMLSYPFRTVSIGILQNYIQEWQSPNFHQREAQVFIALLVAMFAALGFSRRKLNFTDFLLLATFITLALLAWRNVAAFAVVVTPLLIRYAAEALPPFAENPVAPPKKLIGLNWAIAGVLTLAALLKTADAFNPQTNLAALAKLAPVSAAAYLKTQPTQGKLFNAYNFGGYLIWTLYPDYLVYVDGRTDLYDDVLLKEYLSVALATEGWEQVLAKYDARVVIVETGSPLARALAASPSWAVRYQDEMASVLIKNP